MKGADVLEFLGIYSACFILFLAMLFPLINYISKRIYRNNEVK